MTSLRWTALLLPLSVFATGCDPHDEDRVDAVAVSGERIVVTAHTESVGGYGCGGLDEGTPAWLVSSDAGRSFDRLAPEDLRTIAGIAVHAGGFVALRADYDAFAVETSPDGVTWTERTTGDGQAQDLMVDATGIHVAYQGGVLSSADGTTWTDHPVGGAGLYAPRLARVGDRFVRATGDGALATSTDDGDTWAPRTVEDVTSVHRLTAAAGRAMLISHAERAGNYGAYLVAFDPAGDAPARFAPIADGVMAVVDAPAGVLIGDGTLAPAGAIEARVAHTRAFTAGAVDGQRVVLASDDGVAISTDGGATFAPPVGLPLVR